MVLGEGVPHFPFQGLCRGGGDRGAGRGVHGVVQGYGPADSADLLGLVHPAGVYQCSSRRLMPAVLAAAWTFTKVLPLWVNARLSRRGW